MSLTAGTVAVANDGTASGAGLARALYDARMAKVSADPNWASYTLAQTLPTMRSIADFANADAGAIVTYFTANAVIAPGTLVAHVTTESLGRTPNPNLANTAILQPNTPVDVPVTGAGVLS